MSKNTFVFDLEWAEVLSEYPPEIRFEVYEAIIGYAASGTLPNLKPVANMAFSFIKRQMDYNREKYESVLEKRRSAGQKGGLARQTNAITEEQCLANEANEANANDAKQCQADEADNVIVTDIVYDNDKYLTLPLGVGEGHDEKVRKAYMDVFFGTPSSTESFVKRWETTQEELRDMCEAVLDEWTIFNEVHTSADDARKHFVSAVRTRYEKKIKSRPAEKRSSGSRGKKKEPEPKPDPDEQAIIRIDKQKKERDEECEQRASRAMKPADYIRSKGYDPAKVTIQQAGDPEWRAKNPPTLAV